MSVIVRKVDVKVDPILFGKSAREMGFTVSHGTAYDYYGNISEVNCETVVSIPGKKTNIGVKDGVLIYDHLLQSTVGRIMARYHEANITSRIPKTLIKSRTETDRNVVIVLKGRIS